MSSIDDTDSWENLQIEPPTEGRSPRWTPAQVMIDAAGLSHTGYVRTNNEDHFLITRFGRFLESVQSNLPAEEIPPRHEVMGNALLVADGLGGHAAGETASKSALQILYNLVADTPDWILRLDEPRQAHEVERRADERIAQISDAMTEQADVQPELRGFGTTLTAAWGIGEKWFLAHLGDSRAYRLRQGALKQLSHDHTMAQELADLGAIDPHHVALHPLRSRLTRLVGDQTQHLTPLIRPFTVADGDALLLCTDGLTDMVDDELITDILAVRQPAVLTARSLLDAALVGGGKDNVTVIVARLRLKSEAGAPPH
jgi:protein phosphatase